MAKKQDDLFEEALEGDDPRDQTEEQDKTQDSDKETEKPDAEQEEEQQAADKADERLAHVEEREEETGDKEETAEQQEQRHKRTSKERRDARKRYQNGLRAENQYLASQVQTLMQRLTAIETGQGDSRLAILDSDIKRCSDEVATADRVYANALNAAVSGTAGAAEDVLQATKFREQATDRLRQLNQDRERLTTALTQAKNQPPQTLPAPGSAQADQHEARFRADRPWLQFDAQSRPLNIESGVARTIGIAMRAAGLDPATPDYWTELDTRLRGALPQMFEDDARDESDEGEEEEPPPRRETTPARRDRGPPVGKSGRNAGSNRQTVIPKEVVDYIKEAGMWDDPKERADVLKYLREAGTIK